MLSPETEQALAQALDAVIQEAGDDPQYASLVQHLTEAQDSLGSAEAAPTDDAAPADAPAADSPAEHTPTAQDPHGFGAAKDAFIAQRKAAA